jgi:RecB family exonuclease
MNQITNFSPNMLKTFEDCPYKFFLKYIQKLSLPQKNVFETGKKVHALANYYLNQKNVEKFEHALSTEEKLVWDSLKSNKYFELDVVKTEYNLSCKIGNYWIGGRLDALMKDSSKPQYYILDYKTGKIPKDAKNDYQTIVYLLCTDRLLNKNGSYDALKFVYIGLKQGIEEEIELNDELKKLYGEKIINACQKIENAINSGSFSKSLQICEKCEFCKICK